MRRHPEIGARILGSSELADIRSWVLASHERPDGAGYPRGLAGGEIPLESKIICVADAYETMTTDHTYGPRWVTSGREMSAAAPARSSTPRWWMRSSPCSTGPRRRPRVCSRTSHFKRAGIRVVSGGPAAMDSSGFLRRRAGVATLTLNRPEQRNALSGQLLTELVDATKRARDDDDVRAVVLTGAGEKVFCAGADLGSFAADVPLVPKHYASNLFLEFFRLMPRLGKPSLCAANGHVLAGGMGLALSCDLVIAKEGATSARPRSTSAPSPT